MKFLFSFAITMFFLSMSLSSSLASAQQSSYELSCRAKAKELAAETYRNCVSENKAAEISRLKKDYQEKLRNLKDEYEGEVSRLGLKKAKKGSNSTTQTTTTVTQQRSTEVDESQMDLPEPIPVEVPSKNSF